VICSPCFLSRYPSTDKNRNLSKLTVIPSIHRLARLIILVYRNFHLGRRTTATLEALPGDAGRATLQLARPWTFPPGQYLYLYIPSIGGWTFHPFSIAWSAADHSLHPSWSEKGPIEYDPAIRGSFARQPNSISLLNRWRTGFTDHLFRKADFHAQKQNRNLIDNGPQTLSHQVRYHLPISDQPA
jgi:hypothetical protein